VYFFRSAWIIVIPARKLEVIQRWRSAGWPTWLFWGQICKFWPFFNSFDLFYIWKKAK